MTCVINHCIPIYTEHMYLIFRVASEILMNGFEIDYWNVWKVVSQVPHWGKEKGAKKYLSEIWTQNCNMG